MYDATAFAATCSLTSNGNVYGLFQRFDSKMNNKSKSSKSKSKPNGFVAFMLEYRRKQARNGNEMTLTDAQQKAGEIWKVRLSFIFVQIPGN